MVDSWTVDTLQIFRDNIDTREPPVTLHGQIVLIHTLQDILDEAEATVRKRAWNSHFSGGLGRFWSQSSFSHLAPHSFIRSFIFHSDFNNVYYMSTFVRIHSMKYVQVMMMIQENEPGTATFMEDSARDAGTVILAEVIRRCWMILYFLMINIQTRHRQKGLEQ